MEKVSSLSYKEIFGEGGDSFGDIFVDSGGCDQSTDR